MNRAHAAIAWLALGLSVAVYGCKEDSESSIDKPPSPPVASGAASEGSTTDPVSSTGDSLCQCAIDCACADDEFCGADFSVDAPVPADADFSCRDACIPVGAVSSWCFDDASCCEGTCGDDGMCRTASADGGSSSGSGGSGSDSDGSGSSSGGSDSGTAGSSSGSGR